MKGNNKKNIVSLVVLCVSIIALTTSLTYAYFASQTGEKIEEKFSVTSGVLSLTFRDNDDTVENLVGSWNFGDTIEKELVLENTGTKDAYAKISWDNLINTYLKESLTYTLEEKTDEAGSTWRIVETEGTNVPQSTTSSTKTLADHILIPAGKTYTYRLRITLEDLPNIDQTADLNANFITKFTIEESTESLYNKIKRTAKNTIPNFAEPATTDETKDGLFAMEDDYGTSYYYRGDVENNYLVFGGFYWRIMRINGDGTIRIIYDGTTAHRNGESSMDRSAIHDTSYNLNRDDAKYLGYMFGGQTGEASTSYEQATKNETDSEAKKALDEWYEKNLLKYDHYIADSIFCNGRNMYKSPLNDMDTQLGYGSNRTWYDFMLFYPKQEITLSCPQQNDSFTVKDLKNGNGALTYPIGLPTFNDARIAGATYDENQEAPNTEFYLYKGHSYMTNTPNAFNHAYQAHINYVIEDGQLSWIKQGVISSVSIAPVINLKAEYLNKLLGDGTLSNPFYLSGN